MSNQRKITAHISPYIDGLAAETHARCKTRVRFVATANRIEAIGNLERAAKSSTLGGWLLRRALAAGYLDIEKRPVWARREIRKQTDREIESERPALRRGNSLHRAKLRKLDKNRSRRRLTEEQLLSPQDVLVRKLRVAAGTLYHLVDAIPAASRDRLGIYPDDFRYPLVPLWREEKMRLPGLGLRDYWQIDLLLFKDGKHRRVIRQKGASPVSHILITPELTAFHLLLWRQLMPPKTQWMLEYLYRLYRIDHQWPKWPAPECRALFDRCSGAEPKRATAAVAIAIPGVHRHHVAGKRHANLAATRAAYNEKHGSYWNGVGLSRRLLHAGARGRGSLNLDILNQLERNNSQAMDRNETWMLKPKERSAQ